MILPDLKLPSRIGQRWKYSGIDCAEHCLDKQHFAKYPYAIEYEYNSRGFRDAEWPQSLTDLKNCIWCVGDSFTVGIGSALSHTWPLRLSQHTGRRVINVSLDGASNEWIADTAVQIANAVQPQRMVIMWSYTHRRQRPNTALDAEQRRTESITATDAENWQNWTHCWQQVRHSAATTVHLAVPHFHPGQVRMHRAWRDIRGSSWPQRPPESLAGMQALPDYVLQELKSVHGCHDAMLAWLEFRDRLAAEYQVTVVENLDWARDGHHFDIITADWTAQQVVSQWH